MSYFSPYVPPAGGLFTLVAAVTVIVALAAIGNAITRRDRVGGADALAGFGLLGAILSVLPWLGSVDLRWLAVALLFAAVLAAWWRRHAWRGNELWRPFILFLPVLVVACGVPLDQWDSFSHWGPNTAWLWRHHALPSPEFPVPPSSHPEYPYGYPFLLYAVGLVRGGWADNAGAVVNALLLVPAAAVLAKATAAFDDDREANRAWRHAAWGVLLAFPLMPWIMRSATLAAYADTLLAVSALACVFSLWSLLENRRKDAGGYVGPGSLFAFTALAVATAKESGWLMLAVIGVAGLLLALRISRPRRIPALLVASLVPAAAAAGLWQGWIAGWLPESLQVLPLDQWRWTMLPSLLQGVSREVLDNGFFYALLAAAVAMGVGGLVRPDGANARFRALAALVILGHHAVLFIAYLGASFSAEEVGRAASLYRYGTQTGLLAMASVATWIAERHRDRADAAHETWIVAGVVIVLLLAAPYLHRELSARERFFLERGRELALRLPPGATIGMSGWRCDPYAFHLLSYAMYSPETTRAGVILERAAGPGGGRLPRARFDYLVRLGGACLQPAPAADMLLYRRRPGGWRQVDAWRIE